METITFDRASRRCQNGRIDFFPLAGTPNNEECTPAGGEIKLQEMECLAYIGQLIRMHGEPPEGAEFFIIKNQHEAGIYLEAGIWYTNTNYDEQEVDDQDEHPSLLYAWKCEAGPDKWDAEAIKYLESSKHPRYCTPVIPMRKAS